MLAEALLQDAGPPRFFLSFLCLLAVTGPWKLWIKPSPFFARFYPSNCGKAARRFAFPSVVAISTGLPVSFFLVLFLSLWKNVVPRSPIRGVRRSGRRLGRRFCRRFRRRSARFGRLTFLQRSAESIGFRSGFQDVSTVGNAIQQCLAEPNIAEDLSPF